MYCTGRRTYGEHKCAWKLGQLDERMEGAVPAANKIRLTVAKGLDVYTQQECGALGINKYSSSYRIVDSAALRN